MTDKDTNNSTLARSEDGTVQITFSIPWKEVQKVKEEVIEQISTEITVPGFRKGKAPKEKVISHIDKNVLMEKVLNKILPGLVTKLIKEFKIKPAVYPKVELVKVEEDENWQIRIVTCELPSINLGNYKDNIRGIKRSKDIWTPGKGDKEKPKEKSREEVEQEILKSLLESVGVKIPKMLIDEEVNTRLAQLLEKIEKLGLTLESYLASTSKTVETLRKEYEKQAEDAIKIELILNKIAQEENITIEQEKVEEIIKASSPDPATHEKMSQPDQKRLIESVLLRRQALEHLASL